MAKKKYTTGEKAKVALLWMLMCGCCVLNVMVKIGFPPFMRFVPGSIPMSFCGLYCILALVLPYYYKSN